MEYQFILDKIVNTSKQIFGEELTGIYLHGSLAMGCFHPDKSDIDLILVIKDSVSDGQKRRLMDILVELNETGPRKGLEFSMVTEEACRSREYPTPFELHFSPSDPPGMVPVGSGGLYKKDEGNGSGSVRSFHDHPALWHCFVWQTGGRGI